MEELKKALLARERYRTPIESAVVVSELVVNATRSFYTVARKTGDIVNNVPGPAGIAAGRGVSIGYEDSANGQHYSPIILATAQGRSQSQLVNKISRFKESAPAGPPPAIMSVSIADGAYALGETVLVSVTFSATVQVTGVPILFLDIGGVFKYATYTGGSGTSMLSFAYVVESSLTDEDGIIAVANGLSGAITAAGKQLPLTYAQAHNPNATVDTTPPTAVITMSDYALRLGETATVTIEFSEPIYPATFDLSDLTAPNGVLSALATEDNILWTALFTPAIGVLASANVISLSSGYTDPAGNTGVTATSNNYMIATAPFFMVGDRNGYAFLWRNATEGFITIGGLSTSARGVSADGSVVVGRGPSQAFRWTEAGGMVALPLLSPYLASEASGVSADGSVIVGSLLNPVGGFQDPQPCLWVNGVIQGLGVLPNNVRGRAYAVSADGSVVVGSCDDGVSHTAFRWTSAGGMVALGQGIALAVSNDGSVIVGGYTASNQGFRWTEAGGMVIIPDTIRALGVSADGSVVVGERQGSAFHWTQADGVTAIIPNTSAAYGVSADGSVVVGESTFIWSKNSGFMLRDSGSAYGVAG